MKRKKYYCLLLNNGYDIGHTIACYGECSLIPDVLEREYNILDKQTLEDDFFLLDTSITTKENSFTVKGNFPVIAEEIYGEMVDIITGEIIHFSDGSQIVDGLSYNSKSQAQTSIVEALISILDDESRKRYAVELQNIKLTTKLTNIRQMRPRYYKLKLNNVPTHIANPLPIYAKLICGKMIDIITLKPITFGKRSTIDCGLTYKSASLVEPEEVMSYLTDILKNSTIKQKQHQEEIETTSKCSARAYNDYVTIELPKILSERNIQAQADNGKVKTRNIQE